VEAFIAIPCNPEPFLCLVCRTPGHERPACGLHGLCRSCDRVRRRRGQTVEEFVAGAEPRRSFGRCLRCERWAEIRSPQLCVRCRMTWRTWGEPDLAQLLELPLPAERRIHGLGFDLSSLGERARLEILYAFQERWLDGDHQWGISGQRIQSVVAAMRRAGATSLLDELDVRGQDERKLWRELRAVVDRLLADPERELDRDVWRLGLLRSDGGRSTLDYSAITQPWLRELLKHQNRQQLVSVSVNVLRFNRRVAVELSGVLALRADRGEDPRALGRQDAVDFLVHLRAGAARGTMTSKRHGEFVRKVMAMLREARDRGLHRRSGPLQGLADTFVFYDADVPRAPARDPEGEPERALPQVVIDQLLAPVAIARLHEIAGEAIGCGLELQMRTGRRPQEIAHAPFRCLEHEQRVREDGRVEPLPVFVYRPEKRPKTRKELPIFAEEERVIRRMQALARERFPDADAARLPLLPCGPPNRDGRKPLGSTALSNSMRKWVDSLEELLGPDGEPVDRRKVFPYAFRHSYAQRLADQGASESELMDLMDHDSFETTRGYFRIRAERRRRAAELGRKALFDNQGRRLMRGLEHLAEAERRRMSLGSLAVPYGACVEPANVASMGGACKFMLKCLGCKFFRTDLSHLPALENYERQLVSARERLLAEAEVTELEDWARQAALPLEAELDRVRHLIGRIRDGMEELTPAERAELQELLAAERTNRSAILGRLPARHELNVLNVGATFDGVAAS